MEICDTSDSSEYKRFLGFILLTGKNILKTEGKKNF